MNPRAKVLLATAIGVVLALILAGQLANESYALMGVLGVATLWLLVEWRNEARPDAWFLAAGIVGYTLGNRGFAQISLIPNFPLFPGELILLAVVPTLLIRTGMRKRLPFKLDGLNIAILLWIGLGLFRIPIDLRHNGVMALRDFAMVFYAVLFFVAQEIGSHPASAKLLNRAFTLAFALLPLLIPLTMIAPEFFLTQFTFRDIPLVFHKSDLTAAFCSAGFFWLWQLRVKTGNRVWLVLAAISLLLLGTLASPRAGLVALIAVTVLWVIMRGLRIFVFQACIVALALAVVIPSALLLKKDVKETEAYSTYEKIVSVFDFQGKGTYVHNQSGDPGDNNQFRLVWWRELTKETLHKSPILGLGFGTDLSAGFLAEYDLVGAEDFTARSPHSILFSVLGRMGLLGLSLWLGIIVFAVRAFRRGTLDGDLTTMALWSVTWVLLLCACVGVLIEGPMGAVVFWTALGLANSRTPEAGKGVLAEDLEHETEVE